MRPSNDTGDAGGHGIARRSLLRRLGGVGVAAGAGPAAGCGSVLSNDGPIDCEPADRMLDTADWPLPDRDPGNTRAAPASARPPADPERTLDVEFQTLDQAPSPIVVGEEVFALQIARDATLGLASVGLTDGTVGWRRTLDGPDRPGTILGIGDRLYHDDEDLRAYHASGGDPGWDAASTTPVTVADGRIVTVHGNEPIVTDSVTVRGRHAGTGEPCWERVVELAERDQRNSPWPDRPTVADGRIVFVSEAAVTALAAEDGRREWQVPTELSVGQSLASGDSVLVFDYGREQLGCFALDDGTERWREFVYGHDVEGIAATDEVVVTSGHIPDGAEDVGHVTARDAATGDVLWTRERFGEVSVMFNRITAPTIAGDEVIVAGPTVEGAPAVFRFGLDHGAERGRIELPAPAISGPVVVRGSLVVQTGGRLLAFG